MSSDDPRDQVKYIHWLYERFNQPSLFIPIVVLELKMARQQGYLMIYFKENHESNIAK